MWHAVPIIMAMASDGNSNAKSFNLKENRISIEFVLSDVVPNGDQVMPNFWLFPGQISF